MKITVLTLFPEMILPFFSSSIMKRAVEKGIVEYEIVDFRDYSSGSYNKVDDLPYGGGAGMVLMPEPLSKAIEDRKGPSSRVIFPSPGGRLFNQEMAQELSREDDLLFICRINIVHTIFHDLSFSSSICIFICFFTFLYCEQNLYPAI